MLLHGLLVEHRTDFDVVVLVTPEISPAERALFMQAGAIVTEVEKFTIPNPDWPAYNDVATKLHVWTLLQYSRIVYLDSDIVVCSQPTQSSMRARWDPVSVQYWIRGKMENARVFATPASLWYSPT
ncbi:hypothetical protein JKP88DRAFT_268712 [Tribonema minus]|uniref:Hexosyltransferase n=1 Tax=Tribonema minus TaxID=303371 RepID=A0A836CFP2_9STRA|nr:hypothetical protein JKP88DRAFT_268712 [Tribonema minus]